ncbi:MAG: hypothetical protein V3T30_02065 [Thermodesulfobacteriota bacterium]
MNKKLKLDTLDFPDHRLRGILDDLNNSSELGFNDFIKNKRLLRRDFTQDTTSGDIIDKIYGNRHKSVKTLALYKAKMIKEIQRELRIKLATLPGGINVPNGDTIDQHTDQLGVLKKKMDESFDKYLLSLIQKSDFKNTVAGASEKIVNSHMLA